MRPVVHKFGPELGRFGAADKAKEHDMYHADNGKDFVFLSGEWQLTKDGGKTTVDVCLPETTSTPGEAVIEAVPLEEEPVIEGPIIVDEPVIEEEKKPEPKKKTTKKKEKK